MLTLLWIAGIALIVIPQLLVRGILNKYANEPSSTGRTGQ